MAGKAILQVCGVLQDMLADTILHVCDPQVVVARFHGLGFTQCIRALNRHLLAPQTLPLL